MLWYLFSELKSEILESYLDIDKAGRKDNPFSIKYNEFQCSVSFHSHNRILINFLGVCKSRYEIK